MNCDFYLYRAPATTGPVHEWMQSHAEDLGSADDVRRRVSAILPGLRWHMGFDESWIAESPGHCDTEIILRESEPGVLRFVAACAPPSVLCRLMQALRLTDCYDQDSDELWDPFSVNDCWLQL
jgi:hypothetical protein